MNEIHLDDEFVEDTIADLDDTLIVAVERVLAHNDGLTTIDSNASSRSSSRRGRRASQTPVESAPVYEVPRGECKQTVISALEQVVREVRAKATKSDAVGLRDLAMQEGMLREGVRRWLAEVEEG